MAASNLATDTTTKMRPSLGLYEQPFLDTAKITVRVHTPTLLKILFNNSDYQAFSNKDALIKSVLEFLNYKLQSSFPKFLVTVDSAIESKNSITIKNAFKTYTSIDELDEEDENLQYSKIQNSVKEELSNFLMEIANNAYLFQEFTYQASDNYEFAKFLNVRSQQSQLELIEQRLDSINEELSSFMQDNEFLSVENYSNHEKAVFFYTCQCEQIYKFNTRVKPQIIKYVVKQAAAIVEEAEKFGELYFSENPEIHFKDQRPARVKFDEKLVLEKYKTTLDKLLQSFAIGLRAVDSDYNYSMQELEKLVENRFLNGFNVGYFFANERTFKASRMQKNPPRQF